MSYAVTIIFLIARAQAISFLKTGKRVIPRFLLCLASTLDSKTYRPTKYNGMNKNVCDNT